VLRSSFVIAAYVYVRLIPQDFVRLASAHFPTASGLSILRHASGEALPEKTKPLATKKAVKGFLSDWREAFVISESYGMGDPLARSSPLE
jgi:hypothetical protein